MAKTIDSLKFGSNTHVFTLPYGECSTSAGTVAKTVAVQGGNFSLETGSRVLVKFTTTNTAGSPTLNVSGSGAKPIYYRNAAITPSYLAANRIYEFVYDGSQWELIGDVDTNTTYTFNGAVSTIKDSNLTANRALISNSSGKVAASAVTSTELGYLDGVTSNVQDQFNQLPSIYPAVDQSKRIEIVANTDLNTLITPGTYAIYSSSQVSTLSNAPSGLHKSFRMVVGHCTISASTYLYQEITEYTHGSKWYRYTSNGGSTWYEWTKTFDSSMTIPAANGGTGQTSLINSANALIGSLGAGTTAPDDDMTIITEGTPAYRGQFYRRPASFVWEYIKGKISSVLGLTATSYSGNAATATSATKATQDGSGNTITSTYETKSAATSKLAEAKSYADSAAATVKNDLLNGAGTAYDTLKELGDLIDDNTDAIDALETVAAGKASSTHKHTVSHKPAGSNANTSITPAGSVSSTFTGTAHNHGFTGTAVTSGKPDTTNVTSIYSITDVGSLPSASLSKGTLPSHSYTAPSLTASVANRCLTLTFSAGSHSFSAGSLPSLTFSAGSLPTRSSAISMPNANHTHSVTAEGTVGNTTAGGSVSSTFTGTAAEHTHTFTGTSATLTTSTPTT